MYKRSIVISMMLCIIGTNAFGGFLDKIFKGNVDSKVVGVWKQKANSNVVQLFSDHTGLVTIAKGVGVPCTWSIIYDDKWSCPLIKVNLGVRSLESTFIFLTDLDSKPKEIIFWFIGDKRTSMYEDNVFYKQ